MRINYRSWRCWSSRWGAAAGAATSSCIATANIATRLALENLSEETARTALATDSIASADAVSAARINCRNFGSAGWSLAEAKAGASACTSASGFSTAGRSSSFASAA